MKDMLKNFNTTETWIDVETLANLKGISKRAIRLSFNSKNSNYETKIEIGKGGHLYKIRLSSIEEDLQIKYIHEYYEGRIFMPSRQSNCNSSACSFIG